MWYGLRLSHRVRISWKLFPSCFSTFSLFSTFPQFLKHPPPLKCTLILKSESYLIWGWGEIILDLQKINWYFKDLMLIMWHGRTESLPNSKVPSGEHSSSSQLPSRSCSSKGTAGAPFCRKPDYSSPSKLQRCPSRFWAAVHPGEAFSDLGTHPQLDCKDLEGRQTSSLLVPPFPELLPGKSHGWRSLVGCSPWGH